MLQTVNIKSEETIPLNIYSPDFKYLEFIKEQRIKKLPESQN